MKRFRSARLHRKNVCCPDITLQPVQYRLTIGFGQVQFFDNLRCLGTHSRQFGADIGRLMGKSNCRANMVVAPGVFESHTSFPDMIRVPGLMERSDRAPANISTRKPCLPFISRAGSKRVTQEIDGGSVALSRRACYRFDKFRAIQAFEEGGHKFMFTAAERNELLVCGFIDVEHGIATVRAFFETLRRLITAEHRAENIRAGGQH